MADWFGVDVSDVTCTVPNCERAARSLGLCNRHYLRKRRYGDPLVSLKAANGTNATCSVDGCEKAAHAKQLCPAHYRRWRVNGELGQSPIRSFRSSCEIQGCDRPHVGLGYCKLHLDRLKRNGDPLKLRSIPLEDRFWQYVDTSGSCWDWQASKDRNGYGRFSVGGREGKTSQAHRVSWELLVGEIGERLELDHLCRNRACVNPDHLEPVTHEENMKRSPWNAVHFQRSKTHCPHGHEYDELNTVLDAKGGRQCKMCARESARKGNAKRSRATA